MGSFKDLTNQKIGRLTVLEKTNQRNNQGSVIWKCQCSCGNITYLPTQSLTRKSRPTKSCGCYNKDVSILKNTKDIVGQKFNLLTVTRKAERPLNAKQTGSWWYCNCDCGRKDILVNGNRLKMGITKSCGCLTSSAEVSIQNILKRHNIKFLTQYTLEDCRSPQTNWLLKFDFAIFNNQNSLQFLLEYDGEQHFYGVRFSKDISKMEEKNKRILINDNYKNEYCKQNNIKLYRIPYKQKDALEDIILDILKEEQIICNFKQEKLKSEN